MNPDELISFLLAHASATRDGAAAVLPAERDITLFVALEGETLSLARLARVTPVSGGQPALIVETHRGERVLVRASDVRAVRLSVEKTGERGAGF